MVASRAEARSCQGGWALVSQAPGGWNITVLQHTGPTAVNRGDSTYSYHVLAEETFDRPRSIVDGEFSPVLHVTGGF